MDAFRATLEEVTEADALLHVVDLSHPAWATHIRSVMNILSQMPLAPGPMLVCFNKIDLVDRSTIIEAKEEYPLAIFISAADRLGLENLREKLARLVDYAVVGN